MLATPLSSVNIESLYTYIRTLATDTVWALFKSEYGTWILFIWRGLF